jgi:large subunit ribosomal protein L32e
MSDNYEDMTVAELKALLKEAGLRVSGKKSELIERLTEAQDAPEESEVAEQAVEEVVETTDDSADDVEEDDWDDDDWDDEEDEGHVAKQKPVLSDEMKIALALRVEQKKKTPAFKRTEWFRYKRLSRSGWRAPHGMDNKQRRNYKYRSSLVRVGHGKVAAARGLHPSGFREVMVHNTGDLEVIDPETEAARVGKTVGGRKREQIYSRADELGIRVLNRRRDV